MGLVGAQTSWVLRPFIGGGNDFALFRPRGQTSSKRCFTMCRALRRLKLVSMNTLLLTPMKFCVRSAIVTAPGADADTAPNLLPPLLVCGLFYGAVMGSFAATGSLPRPTQMLYSR